MARETLRADETVKLMLRRTLGSQQLVAPLGSGQLLRISGLAGLCAREEALCAKFQAFRKDRVDVGLDLVFEHGHALHWGFRNRVLPRTHALVGRWQCGNCGALYGGQKEWKAPVSESFVYQQVARPKRCGRCQEDLTGDSSLYKEQWIIHPDYKIAGHPDGFLQMIEHPGLGAFELKSINQRGAWEVRNCAKLDHVVQLQAYMWLTGCRWGKVIYWDKGGQGLSSLIEHYVEYDDGHVEAIKALIRLIWAGVEGRVFPDRICVASDCKRAKLCSMAVECFAKDC